MEEIKKEVEYPEEKQELSDVKLKKVTGGGAFDDVPRVPVQPIDEEKKSQI